MDTTGVILIAGIGLVVGFLLAALIFTLRKETPPEGSARVQIAADAEPNIQIWRAGGDQSLVVAMDGVSYRQGSRLGSEQKEVLTKLSEDLRDWIGDLPHAATESPTAVEPSASGLSQTDQPVKGPSLNPLKVFGDAMKPLDKPEGGPAEESIVSQIDKILQSKLEGTSLEEQGIRLYEGPDQAMVIEIGLDRYTEIDAVPDDQIRQLIRMSVADWERSLGD